MATESVATGTPPTMEVDAQDVLAKFEAANDLGGLIEMVQGILGCVVDTLKSSDESKALWGVLRLLEIAAQKSDITQFSYGDAAEARRVLGLEA